MSPPLQRADGGGHEDPKGHKDHEEDPLVFVIFVIFVAFVARSRGLVTSVS
jgi:hypothetical protein